MLKDSIYLHAGQPVNADCAACGVAPELDELLDGEDASQVLDRSAVLGMAAFQLIVSGVGPWRSIQCGQRR